DRARGGVGPALIELVVMRMCGHAHHDDMLYLGRDPQPSWEYAQVAPQGYADRELYEYWSARDPIRTYAARLERDGVVASGDLDEYRRDATAIVAREARAIVDAPWPAPESAGSGVFAGEQPRSPVEVLDPEVRLKSE